MNKDINKKLLLIIFIVVLIIGIIVIFMILQNKKTQEGYDYNPDYDPNYTIGGENRENKQVEVYEEYYAIKSCIDKYNSVIDSYKYISQELSEEEIEKKKSNLSNSLINILDEQYIQQFKITDQNIEKKDNIKL
ncbi:MAG: hypothetical protein J6O41_01670 [Clostridia bacterium]|nr:hypothetical protein [Clostridia bacterium]